MRLVVTGGGTGGHVFPALEVARLARAQGWEIVYLGSLRGIEGGACRKAGIPFHGFGSEPLYSPKTVKGVVALAKLARASADASKKLKVLRPAAVFSTGGYSSAPVVAAARRLHIPYVLHEQNSVPGRTNKMAAKHAAKIATTFVGAETHFPADKVVRTGLPVRRELREMASAPRFDYDALPLRVLVFGGSQGSAAINEAALATAARLVGKEIRWVHVTGRAHFETLFPSYEKLGLSSIYEMKSFLEGEAMGEAYSESSLVVSRSGAGTLSELAAFQLPSVLVPYPQAYAGHQQANAEEFRLMGASTLIDQGALHPSVLEQHLIEWMESPDRREQARARLREWDSPNAGEEIIKLIGESAKTGKP